MVEWGGSPSVLVPPTGLSGVKAIASGCGHNLALKDDGTVVGWGGTYMSNTPPTGLSGVVAISASCNRSVALLHDGSVVQWGETLGQIPANLGKIKAVAAGCDHTLALRADGTVAAWGNRDMTYNGQATVPTGLSNVKAIAAGRLNSLALKEDGTVVVWGFGSDAYPSLLAGIDVQAIFAGDGSQNWAIRDTSSTTSRLLPSDGIRPTTRFPPGLAEIRTIDGRILGRRHLESLADASRLGDGILLVEHLESHRTFRTVGTR